MNYEQEIRRQWKYSLNKRQNHLILRVMMSSIKVLVKRKILTKSQFYCLSCMIQVKPYKGKKKRSLEHEEEVLGMGGG